MKKIWTLLVAAITVLAVLTSGCSSSDKTAKPADGKKTTTIGFSISTLNNPFFVSVRKGVEEEAKKLGKLDENKEFFQEKAVNSLLYSIAVSYGESNPMEKSFELIRELTQQKPAVIIGRCSGAIYANDPEATTVFLHADKDCRIKRVMERDGINEKKAAKLIKEVDEKRASFHKFCTGKEWEDASQYQLSIDTGKLDISDAANMIINYINAKNIGQKHL